MEDTTLEAEARRQPARPYHHGDLRNAVIDAALSLLAEKGVEGVTLRQCAARAGVSHGAPGHHFGDLKGVLTAIAVVGFEKLVADMAASLRGQSSGMDRLSAMGAAYVGFALSHPAHFSLMFQKDRLRTDDPQLRRATAAAYGLLAQETAGWAGNGHPKLRRLRDGIWSTVHGYAALLITGQIPVPADLRDGFGSVLSALTETAR